ncbi:MAG: Excinuclease ABC subunit B, partial [uncultured Phycisphaerae bacterium]
RRRDIQLAYNAAHGITPKTIQKAIRTSIESEIKARRTAREAIRVDETGFDQTEILRLLEEEMLEAAKNLEFERAAQLRDKLNEIKGAPRIETGRPLPRSEAEEEGNRIWQPKSSRGKHRGRKGAAK